MNFSNPTLIVGRNGTGKSNLVDALALLSEAMNSPLQAALERRGGFAAIGHRSSARGRPSNLGLAVALRNPDSQTSKAYYGFRLRSLKEYGFKVVREQCALWKTDDSRVWFERKTKNDASQWESNTGSLAPALEANALALPLVGGDSRFQAVFRFLSDMQLYRIDPDAVRSMQDPDGGLRLRFNGSNASSVLRNIQHQSPDEWTSLKELLAKIVPGLTGVRPKKHGNKLTLEFTQKFATLEPVKFEAFSMSDGTLRVLALLIAVSQQPPPSLIVIEEPAVTIHPGELDALWDALRIAGRSMQVVMTTHSPDLLDAQRIADQHIRIASWTAGISQIRPVSSAVRETLRERLMGAGEPLRADALSPDEDVAVGALFPESPWARSAWRFLMFQWSDITFWRRTRASAVRNCQSRPVWAAWRASAHAAACAWTAAYAGSGPGASGRSVPVRVRPCGASGHAGTRRTRCAGRRASSGGNAS